MSKLLEKLERISKGYSSPIGFKSSAAASRMSNMAIIAHIEKGDSAATDSANEYADALLLSEHTKAGSDKSAVPWGVTLTEATAGQMDKIRKGGCDFIVIDAESSPPSILQEEKIARIIEVDPSIPDGLIRAVSQLPVDAVLIGGEAKASIRRLIACQHISNLTSKHLLAHCPMDAAQEYLRELWETGVSGIVVRITGNDGEALAKLRQDIDALPSSRRKKNVKAGASLPFINVSDMRDEGPEEDD